MGYEYFEFQAVDRPLTQKEIDELRRYSSRAEITRTRFTNTYHWGNFKGSPDKWMEKYFDAYLHVASWGQRELSLRLPKSVLPAKTVQEYFTSHFIKVRTTKTHTILDFGKGSEDSYDDFYEGGEGLLAGILPVREELASGDLRPLYLGWLAGIQDLPYETQSYGKDNFEHDDVEHDGFGDDDDEDEELDEGEWDEEDDTGAEAEPPCPPGLKNLTGAQQALADFLKIDPDVLAAAAERSPELKKSNADRKYTAWLKQLSAEKKTDWLIRLATEGHPAQVELRRTFQQSQPAGKRETAAPRRTWAEIRAAAVKQRAARKKRETAAAERARKKKEAAAAAAREKHLDDVQKREEKVWKEVGRWLSSDEQKRYAEAVRLLVDLRDVARRTNDELSFTTRLAQLVRPHQKSLALQRRLTAAGLDYPVIVG